MPMSAKFLPGSGHLATVWISFRSCSGKDAGPARLIFEYATETARQCSQVVQTSNDGEFLKAITCELHAENEHTFVIYKLEENGARSLRIDDVCFTVNKKRKSLMHFSLDFYAICQSMALSSSGKVAQSISSADGHTVTFEASSTDPSYEDAEEVSCISSSLDDLLDSRSSSPSLGTGSIESSKLSSTSQASQDGRKPLRVRFDGDIREIPTTRQLQEEIQQAVEERSRLSKSVGDLSMQLFQMKHEMRDIKETLRHVTELFAMETRKQDIRNGMLSHGRVPKRRRVILDGHVIARAYGGGTFLTEGIEIALEYYIARDVSVVAVISETKLFEISEAGEHGRSAHGKERLRRLIDRGLVSMTPSQTKRGLYILKYALDQGADVVSNDNFRSTVEAQASKSERKKLRTFLEMHRIPFTFIADKFVPNPEYSQLSSSPHSSKSVDRSDTM